MAAGIAIALVTGALLMCWWLWENSSYIQTLKKIPSPPRLSLLGNLHLIKTGRSDRYQQITTEFIRDFGQKGVCCLWVGPRPLIMLTKAEAVEPLLNSSKHISKAREYDFMIPWLGTGLLTSTGEKWRTRRKLLTPTFHFKILQDFLHVFNDHSRILVKRLGQKAGETKPFNVFSYFTFCTLDIICETAMGKHANTQTDEDSVYAKAVQQISHIVTQRVFSPWLASDFMFNWSQMGRDHDRCLKVLHGFTQQVIRERSAQLDEQLANQTGKVSLEDLQTDKPFLIGKQKRLAFLDMLLIAAKGGADLSFDDIQEEVDTFMFEGHDTTAAATNWTIYLLGRHPEIQERAHREVDDIFGASDRDVTTEDLKKLTYLDCVLKEALRILPAVPLIARLIEEDCVIGGYTLPKGVTGQIFIHALHMDPEHFPDPKKFNPDRWLPENSAGRHPYCYIPFSAGFRNCIGQKFATNEAKTVLSRVLRHFTITSHQTVEETKAVGELILRPEDELLITINHRK